MGTVHLNVLREPNRMILPKKGVYEQTRIAGRVLMYSTITMANYDSSTLATGNQNPFSHIICQVFYSKENEHTCTGN